MTRTLRSGHGLRSPRNACAAGPPEQAACLSWASAEQARLPPFCRSSGEAGKTCEMAIPWVLYHAVTLTPAEREFDEATPSPHLSAGLS
jgi:hypothetical protein